MEVANIVLDYFRVILSAPVLAFAVALITLFTFHDDLKNILSRTAKIRLPGGTEFSTTQSERKIGEIGSGNLTTDDISLGEIPGNLTDEQKSQIEPVIRGYVAAARLWEYRYLNYFLARGTQEVLDWLIRLGENTSVNYYDAHWTPIIPLASERNAIIYALQAYNLISIDQATQSIGITPKGTEYAAWRGQLPQLNPLADTRRTDEYNPTKREESKETREKRSETVEVG